MESKLWKRNRFRQMEETNQVKYDHKSYAYILSGVAFSGLLIANIKLEYITLVSFLAGAYVVHNNPFLCMLCGIFILANMLLGMSSDGKNNDLLPFCMAVSMCTLLTYVNPVIGSVTLLYPLYLGKDMYLNRLDEKRLKAEIAKMDAEEEARAEEKNKEL